MSVLLICMSVHHMYGWCLRRSEEGIYNLSELEL